MFEYEKLGRSGRGEGRTKYAVYARMPGGGVSSYQGLVEGTKRSWRSETLLLKAGSYEAREKVPTYTTRDAAARAVYESNLLEAALAIEKQTAQRAANNPQATGTDIDPGLIQSMSDVLRLYMQLDTDLHYITVGDTVPCVGCLTGVLSLEPTGFMLRNVGLDTPETRYRVARINGRLQDIFEDWMEVPA